MVRRPASVTINTYGTIVLAPDKMNLPRIPLIRQRKSRAQLLVDVFQMFPVAVWGRGEGGGGKWSGMVSCPTNQWSKFRATANTMVKSYMS